jgi:uncharacterized repeat protein (TIGR02543 family)
MNLKSVYAGTAVFLSLVFTACAMMGPEPEQVPDGKTVVRVSVEAPDAQARTALPAAELVDVRVWKLWGGISGSSETMLAEFFGTTTTAPLEGGSWNFTLKGYNEDDGLILQGNKNQNISLDYENNLNFTVEPVLDGDGVFKMTIELPEGHGITTARVFEDEEELDPIEPEDDAIVFEDTYPAGDYYFIFKLYNNDDVLYGVVSEAVWVRMNLRSEKTHTLGLEDLNITYTVNYHLNGGELVGGATNPHFYRSVDAGFALPEPVRRGYTFGGWHTEEEFVYAVTQITQGSTGDKEYWAQWTPIFYQVEYDLNYEGDGFNGYTSQSYHTYGVPSSLNQNRFYRLGYVFDRWNTRADGSGDSYADEEEVSDLCPGDDSDTVTLYAQWTPITYTVEYSANGGTGVMGNSTYTYDTEGTLAPNGFAKTGYVFLAWNTNDNNSGTSYAQGASVNNWCSTQDDTVILYATWMPISYTVAYDANGGSGSMSSDTHTYNREEYLSANSFARTGYRFTGWSAQANGGGTGYADGVRVSNLSSTQGATVTLYARWDEIVYTIAYELYGGTNDEDNPSTYTVTTEGITLKAPVYAGHSFGGWHSDSTFTTPAGVILRGSTGNKTFYAKWLPGVPLTITLHPVPGDPPLSDVSMLLGSSREFTVAAYGGTASQWYWDGAEIGGATNAAYTVIGSERGAGIYVLSVVVTTAGGEKVSAHCWVTIKE